MEKKYLDLFYLATKVEYEDYNDYFHSDDLELFLENKEPLEIFKMGLFAEKNFTFYDDYYYFNGYGHLGSISNYRLEERLKGDEEEIIKEYLKEYGLDKELREYLEEYKEDFELENYDL